MIELFDLTEAQTVKLMRATMATGPATEEELAHVLTWVERVRAWFQLTEMALDGQVSLRWSDERGDVVADLIR